MNIMVISYAGDYDNLGASFIHAQAACYASMGHRVRWLSLRPVGKTDQNGRRLSKGVMKYMVDGMELYDLRYLSLSNFGRRCFNALSAIWAIRANWDEIFADFQPNAVHAHMLDVACEVGKEIKKKLRVPLVVTTHGSDTTILINEGKFEYLRERCEGVDTVVAVSNVLAERLRRCGTETPVKIIINGYKTDDLNLGEERKPLSFLQVSNLIELKQIPVTIRAFAKICELYPEAKLKIIGRGPDRQALEGLCRELGVMQAVTFTGQLPHKEVLTEMAKTQFYVMPSVREGFPVAYLEAMASGCLAVGTATEGIAEIVTDGENGFLVQPGDAETIAQKIFWCLKHPEEAAAIAERGQQDALSLTWGKNAEQYVRLFEELRAK